MKIFLWAVLFVIGSMSVAEAQQARIVCADMFGNYIIVTGQCPWGYKFVSVVDE